MTEIELTQNKKYKESTKYRYWQITSYFCKNCRENYKCKEPYSSVEFKRLKKDNKHITNCQHCNEQHIRCKVKKCINCCQRNKCNDLTCQQCIDLGIKCERTMPKTQEEFDNLDIFNYIKYQHEKGEKGRFHDQCNVQTKKFVTMESIKKKLKDNTLHIEKTRGNFFQADDYCGKIYNRCKVHVSKDKSCKCSYFDLNETCELCDDNCERTLSRWDENDLTNNYPYVFGIPIQHRSLVDVTKNDLDFDISEFSLEDLKKKRRINEESISYEEGILDPKLRPDCLFSSVIGWKIASADIKKLQSQIKYISEYSSSDFVINEELSRWVNENLINKPKRPKSLLLIGETRVGKTEWARSLGTHVYWGQNHNIDTWNENAEYVILDDFTWNYQKRDSLRSLNFDMYKSFIGCQKQFDFTDKYRPKTVLKNGLPCIILCNPDQNPLDGLDDNQTRWFKNNTIIVDLGNTTLINNDFGIVGVVDDKDIYDGVISSNKRKLEDDNNNNINNNIKKVKQTKIDDLL